MTKPKYPTPAQLTERKAWAEQFDRCWVCGDEFGFVVVRECHEIASRAQAPGKWADKRSYFCTCSTCHAKVLSWLPEAAQMALKKQHDPDNYSISWINAARGEAANAISYSDVKQWSEFLKVLRAA